MEKIKRIMLGHIPYNVSLVIITPLKSTFYKLKEVLNIEEIYVNAFFENCVFTIDNKNTKGLIILSPQGISSKDIVELFENMDIIFFGLAGSLNTNINIGSFVEVKTASDEEIDNIKLDTTGELATVKCGYSPCLLGEIAKKYCDIAKYRNCDVVDMETVYCAKTAMEKNNRFISLLLISDIPNVINFWEVSEEEQKKLKQARELAIDKIVNYINIIIRKE